MEYVRIYRALPATTQVIRTGDYVTLSRKFAIEHAVTSAVYNGEDFYVVSSMIKKDQIKDADNLGEYRYIGEDVTAKPTHIAHESGEVEWIGARNIKEITNSWKGYINRK